MPPITLRSSTALSHQAGSAAYLAVLLGVMTTAMAIGGGTMLQMSKDSTDVRRINQTEQDMRAAARYLANQAADNGTSFALPTDVAGELPNGLPIARKDPFGVGYRYCPVAGATGNNDAVLAVVSGGGNRSIQTTCGQALANAPAGDDKVVMLTKADIAAARNASTAGGGAGPALDASSQITVGKVTVGSAAPAGDANTQITVEKDVLVGGAVSVGSVSVVGGISGASASIGGTLSATDINATGTVTAGSLTLTTPLAIASGGTGAATADGALGNLGGTGVGKSLFRAANQAAARDALGAGAVGANVFQAADQAAARGALGIGTIATQNISGISTSLMPASWLYGVNLGASYSRWGTVYANNLDLATGGTITANLTGDVTGNLIGNADSATTATTATNANYATLAGGIAFPNTIPLRAGGTGGDLSGASAGILVKSLNGAINMSITPFTGNNNDVLRGDGTFSPLVFSWTGGAVTGQILAAATTDNPPLITPAYSFGNATKTGMYLDSGNNLGFVVGGSELYAINSAGQLIIKNGSTAGTPAIAIGSAGAGTGLSGFTNSLVLSVGGFAKVTANSNGVFIGDTLSALAANATTGFFAVPAIASVPTGNPAITGNGVAAMAYCKGCQTLYVHTGSGWKSVDGTFGTNVQIGMGSSVGLGSSNRIAIGYNVTAAADNVAVIGNSSITTVTLGSTATTVVNAKQFVNGSDRRLKHDIADLTGGLDLVRQLHPVTYAMNGGDGRTEMGFIAQELQQVPLASGAVYQPAGQDMLAVSYTALVAPTVKAVQELADNVDGLKARLDRQEREIKELKAALRRLQMPG